MARKRERERKRGERVQSWFWVLFLVCLSTLCTSQWFPAPNPCWRFTPNEKDVPNGRKCFSPSLSRDAASHIGQTGGRLFPPFYPFSRWLCWHICTPHSQTHRAVSQNHSQSHQMRSSGTAVLQHLSQNSLWFFLIPSQTQYTFTHFW